MSLIPIVGLGIVLAGTVHDDIVQRALSNARQSAELLDRSLVQPQMTAREMRVGLTAAQVASLDHVLRGALDQRQIARIKVWTPGGRAAYASDHPLIGKSFALSDELRTALAGRTASEVSTLTGAENASDRSFGRLLEVYTPLRFSNGGPPAGAFELYVPYAPIAAAVSHDTHRLYGLLVAGLALLYLTLFPIVAGASIRLRRHAAEKEHRALHDALTGLPNRTLLRDRVQNAIRMASREQTSAALLLLDLDRFKEVNDTLGHHNGDALLKEIGARLQGVLRDSDTVARLGGDEFALLLPKIAAAGDAREVAEKVRRALRAPCELQGVTLDLDASIGIAIYPEDGSDVETLLQRADVAMYLAKEDRSHCEVYTTERDHYSPARLALVGQLREALDRGELVVYYQPQATLDSGEISGVEALLRWQHPKRGLIGPQEFIPLAERTGLIKEVTLYVLDAALAQAHAWQQSGLDLRVSVNLSARDLIDVALPDTIRTMLSRHKVGANRLSLEITETVILADPMRARAVLARLGEMGVHLAIDDYGSGYSSLAYLKRLPVAELKIDRSFVMHMEQDDNDAVIVRSTIDLARNLGLTVVAEGVETAETWSRLRDLGCDIAQGFYLSRPIPAADLTAFVQSTSRKLVQADGATVAQREPAV